MTQIAQATVKFTAGQPRDTKNGPRINVVCTLPTGEEIKLWGNPGDPIQNLKKGQSVQVVNTGKGWSFGETSPDTVNSPAPAGNPVGFKEPSKETRQDMADYIAFAGKIHKHCFSTAKENHPEMSDTDLTPIATTLFIQAMRRFNP